MPKINVLTVAVTFKIARQFKEDNVTLHHSGKAGYATGWSSLQLAVDRLNIVLLSAVDSRVFAIR